MADQGARPNILFFHVDNLGLGELGCYGGGVVRGADTRRIDAFSREALQLRHYIAEPQCTPSRSALMTGRHAIRSGNHTVASGLIKGGIVAWERTMGDILSEAGYATACHGKWHIGAEDGRWPTDHGFDEWFGPPRSYAECAWPDDPWYRPERDTPVYMLEGTKAGGVAERKDLQMTMDLKRNVDAEYMRRGESFVRRSVAAGKAFYLYFNHSLMHWPTLPRPEFTGKSGNGDWADCLLELDHDFGRMLDLLGELGVADNTIVVFAGDNGAEDKLLWRGSPGVFEGSYFTSSEGGLRTPCLIRWPGQVVPDRVSNEMVHQVDMFTTLLRWVGCDIPTDRVIDGLDQRAFFEGKTAESAREGCLVWLKDVLHGVKWRNFKYMYIRQQYQDEPAEHLSTPHVINLMTDPKEREAHNQVFLHSWVGAHARRLLDEFKASVAREPLIPAGSPVDHRPV
ncbi:MAG: sulfatase-like hydrolase/transferase [Chloroflexota bacterium]